MRKNIAVYPFTREFLPYFSYFQEFHPDYVITSLVSPKGFSMAGKDGGVFDNRGEIGMLVEDDINAALEKAQALLIPDSSSCEKMRSKILSVISKAILQGKDILCAMPLTSEELEKYKNLGYEKQFLYYAEPECFSIRNRTTDMITDINTPVVFIGEFLENSDAVDVLMSLATQFRKNGYTVSSIGFRKDSRMVGIHTYPDFFYETSVSNQAKVSGFNAFLADMEAEEQPDVFLIQLPGGLMKYNNRHLNGMGIDAYLVAQAATCDCFVLSASCGFASPEIFEELGKHFRETLNAKVNAISISNRLVDSIDLVASTGVLKYFYFTTKRVREILDRYCSDKSSIPFFPLFEEDSRVKLYQAVIRCLTGNPIVY